MTDVGAGEEFTWAELVSDGHVRAARLRWMQPWLIAIGVGCILLGFYVGSLTASASASIAISAAGEKDTLMGQVNAARSRVNKAESDLPQLNMTSDQVKALPAAKAIGTDVLPSVRAALASGTLPKDIPTVAVSPKAFWQESWPSAKLVITGDDKVKVVGALVAEGSEYYAVPKRWIGVFRKKGDEWQYVTAEGRGLVDVPGTTKVELADIPLTLSPVLPLLSKLDEAGKGLENMAANGSI